MCNYKLKFENILFSKINKMCFHLFIDIFVYYVKIAYTKNGYTSIRKQFYLVWGRSTEVVVMENMSLFIWAKSRRKKQETMPFFSLL